MIPNAVIAPPPPASDGSAFGVVSGMFRSYGPAVINGLIIVSTISGQSLIGKLTFTCPCAYPLNVYHSCTFIFGPAVALFTFSLLINSTTWKLVHGCCHRTSKSEHPWGVACLYWLQITAQSSIASVAWLFVAFLNGTYYTCMRAGAFCAMETTNKCENATAVQIALVSVPLALIEVNQNVCPLCVCSLDPVSDGYLHSQSQVIAWILVVGIGISALTVICIVRMCDKYTYVQNEFVHTYREEEARIFKDVAKEHARTYADYNARQFFGSTQLSKEDWDVISSLPSIENPYLFRSRLKKKQISTKHWEYTTLQRWMNEYSHNHTITSMTAAQPPPIPGFMGHDVDKQD